MLIGLVELSSIRKLGTLNGHSEKFLWYTSFIFKSINAVLMPIWGLTLDKTGFKNLYSVILSVQLIISSLCFFISSSQLGFILYNGISSILHSVNISIHITTFASIFGNVKGILLYSISWLLINIFYIARSFIGNVFVSKIYYLMFYIGLTLFTMIALIILCFLDEKKHIYTGEKKFDDSSSSSDEGNELDDLQFEDSDEKINESNSKIPSNISLKNKNQ
jgi:MFS family permease